MRKSFPRLFAHNYRLFVVCIILTGLIGFSISASSHSGGASDDSQLNTASNAAQPGNAAGIIASVFNFPMPVPTLTATMADSFPTGYDVDGDGKADVGDKIRYTVTINNTGTDANNLTLQDTIDPNTSLINGNDPVTGGLNISPVAKNDSYNAIGNTELVVGTTAVGNAFSSVSGSVKDNDVEYLGDTSTVVAITNGPTTQGGTVNMETDGNFTYLPPVNFTGSDTFTYTLKDDGIDNVAGNGDDLSDTATVTITVSNRVWYVDNSYAGANGASDGRSTRPFTTLVPLNGPLGVGDSDSPNDVIYVFTGSTNYITGIELESGQSLIGNGVALVVNSTTLRAAGTRPTINNAAGDAVNVSNISGVVIRGFNLQGSDNAVEVATSGANNGSVEIADNFILGAGANGIDITGNGSSSSFTLAASVHDNTITATGNGIDIFRQGGNVQITAFDDNVVLGTTGGVGINVLGSGGSVLFDSNPATAVYDTVSGGTTTIGATGAGNGVGLGGMALTNVRGDLSFTDLDIWTDNGTALSLLGTTPNFNATTSSGGPTGVRVTANSGSPTLVAVSTSSGGAALDVTDANINMVPTTMSSTNSNATGVSLVRTSGTFTAPSGATITNAAGTDFAINGNSNANANVNVTYPGTITDDTGALVTITNVTASSTHTFSGLITDNFDGDGGEQGISMSGSTGANVTFSGGLNIRTTTLAAFSATGGGTLTITDPSGATANKLQTTSGTPLTVSSTNIGASGLTFESIAANGAANGIFLSSTGSSGGLTVTGDGTNTTKGGNATGGTIQNINGADATTNGIAIYLNNTRSVVLRRMTISGTIQNMGVYGELVNGLTMQYCTVGGTIGTTTGSNDLNLEVPVAFGKTSPSIANGFASGSTNTIDNCLISGGIQHNVEIFQQANAFTLNITNSNITNNGAALGSDGINIETHTDSNGGTTRATATISVQSCLFDNNKSQALQANALGDSFLDLTLSGNTVQKTTQGNEGFVLQNGGDADMVLHVTSNNMSGLLGNMLHVGQVAGNATSNASLTAFIQNNVLTQGSPVANRALTVFPSSNFAAGFVATSNILLDNNQVTSSTDAEAFFVSTPDAGASPAFTATVTNNTVTMTSNTGNAIRGMALQATQGSTSTGAAACFDVRNNVVTYTNGAPAGINGIRVRQANPGGGHQNPTVNLEQGSSAGAASTVLAANNPGSTTEVVGTVTVVSNSTCQNPPVSFFNTPNNQREYFAQAEDSFQNSNSPLLASINNDLVPVSELIARSAEVSKDSAGDIDPQKLEALSAIIPIPLELTSTKPATISAKPEIEKSAFALAHGKSNQTLGDSLSSFVSAFVDAVAPTAHAATAPPAAPMPVLEVNKNIGTLPAGESITVVFDVLVDSAKNPHPVASYTNQMTIKADGMSPDVLTDDTPGTAAPNEPTVTPGDRYNTSTALSANPTSPAFQGDSVTFTAVVTPTEGSGVTPNGTVQFKDGASNLGSPVTCSPSAGNTCTATFNTSSLTAATHNITAEYSGGTNHDASTSNTVVYVVNPCTVNPVVLNTSDGTGPVPAGSLREAVTSVCTGNTITFDPSVTGQINLVAALPDLSRNMTITGPGADVLEVRGSQALGNSYRVFNITNGTVNISGLTISNGADALGGGGVNNTSTLTLTEVTVKSNNTTATGGGILSSGTLNLIRSTVSNNVASLQGGGIYNTGNLSITNSTISTNTANAAGVGLGGGIYSTTGVQTVTIASSTIASNSADASGGGIYNAAGTIDIGNTIAADNTATASPDLSGAGTFNSNDYNLIESSTVVFTGTTTHNITGVDPSLGALTDNGGPTFTHALLHGSAAIDQGNTALTVDQRNQPREIDNPNVANVAGGDGSDIGAYEAPAPPNAPDLDAASDTGASSTDNVTSDNTPTFTISGVTNGATVDLLLDGNPVPVATGTAAGTSIQLTSSTVGEGVHTFTARQTVAGGTSPNSVGLSVTIDTVAPTTPTIDLQTASDTGFSNTDNITNAASLSFDIGNTEAGALVELLRDGTPVASVTSAGGTVVLADTPPEGSFTYTARQTETAGGSATSSGLGVGVDRTGPSVSSITRLNTNPTSAASVGYTVTFDQPVTGVDATDFTVTATGISGASVNTVTGVAPIAAYTVTVNTGTGDGTIRLDVTDDDSIADVAGNVLGGAGAGNGNFTTGEVYTVDKTAPSVLSIVRANANPTNATSVDYTVTFSENVTGVDTADFDLNNAGVAAPSITGVTGSNNVYTVTVNTGTGDGTLRLDFSDNDSVVDGIGNPVGGVGTSNGSFNTGEIYTIDKTAPSINIGSPSSAISNGSNVTYTVTYADANFNTSTLTTGNITLNTTGTANATVGVDAGSGTSRTVTLSGITGNGTLGISIAAGTASDTAGNTAPGAGPSATFLVDTTAPTVSSIVRADANPTSAATVNFTVTFSENVTGVDLNAFALTTTGSVSGANAFMLTGSNNVYTVSVNTGTGDGTIRLDVTDNDSIVDQANNPLGGTGAGNGNFTTGEVYTVDKNVPTANITAVTPDPRNTAVSDITIVFSEPITGFDLADLSLTLDGGPNLLPGPATLTNPSADNITWTLGNLSGLTGAAGTYTLTLTASGSGITDGTNALSGDASDSWVVDTTAPTVTIDQAAGQADPVLNATSINFTAVFSEPVTGFDSADITFSGAGATTANVTEITPGLVYNVEITGMNTSGIVTASVNANAAQDAAGNLSAASTSTDNQVLNQQDTATGYEVNSLANTEDGACAPLGTGNGCTLREAITAANLDGGSETITFAPALTSGGPAQITLDGLGALPEITDSVTINGPTDNRLTISGNLSSRIFSIAASQTVNISFLTFIDGRADLGGAIYNLGALTIRNSTFTGNAAIAPFGDGGAIDSDDGNLTIINSTISGNSATGGGGGIHHCGSSTGTLINVTITGNRSDSDDVSPGEGGGLDQVSSNPVTLINTIVAGNFKGTASPVADDIAILSGFSTLDLANSKNNLVGDAATSGGLTNGTNGNIVGNSGAGTIDINTVLQTTLASNGGPTQTHLLWPGSPAVNAGSNCVTLPAGCAPSPLTTDQRGTGYPRLVNGTVDIGAVEVNYEIAPIAGAPQSTPIGTAFSTDSKVTVTESGVLKSGISVTFAAPGSGPSGTFPGGVLTATVNSDVNGIATSPTLTANNIVGGPYTVTGTLTGSTQSTNIGELNNTKIPAQITLSNLVQTYDGTSKVVGVATSPAGLPVQVTYNGSNSPPVNAGTYAVVATIVHSNYEGQALATFIVNQLTQTIDFAALPNKTLGDADFAVNATSSAGLPVSFSASGSCTVSGNTVHLTGAGFCTITASQPGTVNYSAAPSVSHTFTVSQAGTTTAVTSSANPSTPGQNVTFTATVSSPQGTPTGNVQFVIDGFPVGAPVALNGSGVATFQTSTLTVGNHTVIVNYAGDGNFATSGGTLAGGQQVNINPGISIDNVSLTEGDSGAKNFDFTVTLSQASNVNVTVDFATANGTATLVNNDYQSNAGTVTFNPGDTQKTITVAVNGDLASEPNETFFVNLSNAQNGTISDNQGLGTILNDDAPGVVFSSNAFSFAEGAGHGDVIVTRTGDTSQPLTVDYQTSDQSAMTPCQTNNTGFASDRCDYGTASGTLHFAAGETQKTIPIVLVNDAYVEGPEQLSIKLTNPVGGTLGSIDTATVTITDNDTQVATTNPIADLDFFLRQLYLDFFGREPDAAGFNFWKSRMTGNCPAGETCDRADTALRFFESDEFEERGFFIYVFYHASLGRRPTYSEWTLEVSKLNGFLTPAEQQAGRDAFIQRFMNTSEFMNLYNGAQTGQTFVDALIQKSGVNPASRQALINNYNTVGRAETLKAFMATPEIQAAFNDPAFVAMLYYGLLRRDAEPGGFDFWMQQLIQSNHNYRQLIGGFLDSDEYWFRFAQIQSNHPNP